MNLVSSCIVAFLDLYPCICCFIVEPIFEKDKWLLWPLPPSTLGNQILVSYSYHLESDTNISSNYGRWSHNYGDLVIPETTRWNLSSSGQWHGWILRRKWVLPTLWWVSTFLYEHKGSHASMAWYLSFFLIYSFSKWEGVYMKRHFDAKVRHGVKRVLSLNYLT